MPGTLRDATAEDAAAIAEIHNAAVLHSTAIWNDTIVDAADRAEWLLHRRAAGFPVLVLASEDGGVAGYGSYGPFRPHEGYRHTVEHSVYVREDLRGQGIGAALLAALVSDAQTAGVHVMVAAIDADNAASIRLHERVGFVQTGLMPQVGRKFDRWLDLALLQLTLPAPAPAPRAGSAADDAS